MRCKIKNLCINHVTLLEVQYVIKSKEKIKEARERADLVGKKEARERADLIGNLILGGYLHISASDQKSACKNGLPPRVRTDQLILTRVKGGQQR
jgi:hypothetical protein